MNDCQKYIQNTLTNAESKLCKKIYGLLEKHIISICGEFDNSYSCQNTNVTELTMDIIQQVRNQIEFQEQMKKLGF